MQLACAMCHPGTWNEAEEAAVDCLSGLMAEK